jgi:hypothetical protein
LPDLQRKVRRRIDLIADCARRLAELRWRDSDARRSELAQSERQVQGCERRRRAGDFMKETWEYFVLFALLALGLVLLGCGVLLMLRIL